MASSSTQTADVNYEFGTSDHTKGKVLYTKDTAETDELLPADVWEALLATHTNDDTPVIGQYRYTATYHIGY